MSATTTTATLTVLATQLLLAPTPSPTGPTYPTSAGTRVFSPRDWPTWQGEYPVILVSAPRERKESLGRNAPQYTTTSSLRFSARAAVKALPRDGSAGVLEEALWSMQRQIETTLIGAPTLMKLIQQISGVETQLGFSTDGSQHVGELISEMDLEYFQDWDDFAPLQSSLVEEVSVLLSKYQPAGLLAKFPPS